MERKFEPDLHGQFTLLGNDLEKVAPALVESDVDEELDRAEAEVVSEPCVESSGYWRCEVSQALSIGPPRERDVSPELA